MIKRLLILFFLCLQCTWSFAQDPSFTQYYSAPLYLNPAFAGTTNQHRAAVNYRNHWASLPRAFVTYAFTYDYNIKRSNSNIGVLFSTDRAGSASLQSTTVAGIYSYSIPLTDGIRVTPALQIGYVTQSLDFSKLVFGDQLQFGNPDAPSSDPSLRNLGSVNHFDFSSGIVIYDRRMWAGLSIHHLNRPNQSMLEEESVLPMRISAHAGYKIPLKLGPMKSGISSSLNPSFNYRHQGKFNQLDVGVNYYYRMLMLGVWYKGLPLQQDMPKTINHDALAISFGMSMHNLIFGYSYDMTVSKLNPVSTGGSHEVALILQFETSRRPGKVSRKDKYNPCPAFMPNYLWKP